MEHLSEEDLVLLFYNEPSVEKTKRTHLSECLDCSARMDNLSRTLRMADDYTGPEPPPDFERSVWARIAPELEDRKQRRSWRFWAMIPVLAALLVGVFLAGRASVPTAKPILAGLSRQARERILVISLADHLERTGLMLTDLSNVSDSEPALSIDRDRARDLVSEGRLMQQALELSGDRRSSELLDELQLLLVDVANSPDRVTPAALREWQSRIGEGSLLFKVRVVESNLRNKGQKL